MTNVFIAPKIKVGFQKRDDTFTGQLAYIIYYDEKGKLRKEQSWQSWRDKKIDPQEFDNTPMDGFTLNKDVKRYSGEWFSSHRTMIRVHDPRGFEFEVTTENLIAILMHTDCLRRGLIGQFVYAWVGPELVLLPTNSEEYQASVKYTVGLSKKVGAKNLIAGVSYKTKREGDVIYLGRFNWYSYKTQGGRYSNESGPRKEEKVHVFTKDNGKTFFKKSSVEFLSEANSDQPVSNYAELVDKFNKKTYANKIVKYEFRPVVFDESSRENKYSWNGPELCRSYYFINVGGTFREATASRINKREYIDPNLNSYDRSNVRYILEQYSIEYQNYYETVAIMPDTGDLVIIPRNDSSGYYYSYNKNKSLDPKSQELFDLYVTYENGKKVKIESLSKLTCND